MAQIKPFKALRYTKKAGAIEALTCPPYDIISESQRQGYLKTNPNNMIRLELPREGRDFYATAGQTLREWERGGILAQDSRDSFYIYEIEFAVKGQKDSVKGLICRVKLEEFSKEIILPHEETLSKAKTDRFNLMKATNCNFSQIYSLYMDDGGVRNQLHGLSAGVPEIEMTDEQGLIHRLWTITDPEQTAQISARFEQKKLFIADGHHRYETALNYRNWLREQGKAAPGDAADCVMMMLVDMENPGLHVFATHRIVKNLAQFDPAVITEKCGKYFDITDKNGLSGMETELEAQYNKHKKAFAFYCGGQSWKLMTLKAQFEQERFLSDKSPATNGLDVTVLHTLVLENLFGIDRENMANGLNLAYTRDIAEALAEVENGAADCAFILNPTRVSEIREVSLANEKMPQKSTYFYPKLITGLAMNKIR